MAHTNTSTVVGRVASPEHQHLVRMVQYYHDLRSSYLPWEALQRLRMPGVYDVGTVRCVLWHMETPSPAGHIILQGKTHLPCLSILMSLHLVDEIIPCSRGGTHIILLTIQNDEPELLRALLEHGYVGKINTKSYLGDTPLHAAVELRLVEIISLLLQYGANPLRVDDTLKIDVLRASIRQNLTAVVRLILQQLRAEDIPPPLNSRQGIGEDTALGLAARVGSIELLRLLATEGGQINQLNGAGLSPLELTVYRETSARLEPENYWKCIACLVQLGIKVRAEVPPPGLLRAADGRPYSYRTIVAPAAFQLLSAIGFDMTTVYIEGYTIGQQNEFRIRCQQTVPTLMELVRFRIRQRIQQQTRTNLYRDLPKLPVPAKIYKYLFDNQEQPCQDLYHQLQHPV